LTVYDQSVSKPVS